VSGQRFIQDRVRSMTREKVTADVESEAPRRDVQGSQEG